MPKTLTPKPRTRPDETVPAEFRIIEAHGASDFELIEAAGETEGDEAPQLRRFAMTAYTGGKLNLPNFPFPVVVDLSGMRIPAKSRPILRDHSIQQIVGHTESININRSTLRLKGVISGSNEHSREVAESSANGFPWQSSIGAMGSRMVFVDQGESVEVNGRRFTGPIYVARQSVLREVSFVALGADDRTSATLAASHSEARIGVTSMEFEQWLEAQGFNSEDLDETQTASLTAMYEASRESSEPDDDGPDDNELITATGADDEPETEDGDDDPVGVLRARRAAEIRRFYRIGEICRKHPDIEARAIEEGWDETRTELEVLRASRPRGPAIHSEDGSGRSAASIEAALCLSSGLSEDQLGNWYDEKAINAAISRDLRGASIHTLLYEVIRAGGGHARPGRVDNDTILAAFTANNRLIQASSGFSTISLSGILSNVANKAMLAAYTAVNAVATQICATTDANDFKQFTRYRMTATGMFQKVGPDGEIKHTTLDEESYSNQVETYGRMIALTRQMMINDDLGAFLQIPRAIGRMSALALEEAVFVLLLSNPNNFFDAGNNNYFEGATSALDIDSLTTAEQMFLDRVDKNGKPILILPAMLLVPTSLKVTAEQLFNQTEINQQPANNKAKPAGNPHAKKFRPVVSPYLGLSSLAGNSQTAWYLLAAPSDVAAMEIAYLRGRRTPTIESGETDFNTLGMQWRGYFDFGVAMQDHRAAVKSKGAA